MVAGDHAPSLLGSSLLETSSFFFFFLFPPPCGTLFPPFLEFFIWKLLEVLFPSDFSAFFLSFFSLFLYERLWISLLESFPSYGEVAPRFKVFHAVFGTLPEIFFFVFSPQVLQ